MAREKKIMFSFVFALVLIAAASASQGLFADSNVLNAQVINLDVQNNNGGDKGGNGNGDGKGGGGSDNVKLCGFAWGATSEVVTPKMGLGWVSFNSEDCDIDGNGSVNADDRNAGAPAQCPDGRIGSYSVAVDDNSNLVGYAWSSNLGWLKFGGLAGFPTASGNNQQNARINGDGTVTGWARFCAGTQGGSCLSSTSRNDGWDGWVSLRGNSPIYGVRVDQDDFEGYSWGSQVVGWLNWNPGTGNGVRFCDGAPSQGLVASLQANPSSGPVVLNTTLTASYQLTSGTSNATAQYRFKCDSAGAWSSAQSSATYQCNYSQHSTTYYPQVQVTLGSLVSESTAQVRTDDDNNPPPPPPPGGLDAACTVTRPSFVGQPVTWTVTLESVSVGPYDYQFEFSDGQGDTTIFDSANDEEEVVVTYTSPGNRILTATVTDSAATPVTVNCSQDTNVIVRPIIIPI